MDDMWGPVFVENLREAVPDTLWLSLDFFMQYPVLSSTLFLVTVAALLFAFVRGKQQKAIALQLGAMKTLLYHESNVWLVCTPEGRVIEANDRFRSLLHELDPTGHLPKIIQEHLLEKVSETIEFDGKIYLTHIHPLGFKNFLLIKLADVTPLQKKLSTLEKSFETYKVNQAFAALTLDNIPRPAWIRDESQRLIYCNRYYAEALDMSVEEVLESQQLLWCTTNDETTDRRFFTSPLKSIVICKGDRRTFRFYEFPIPESSLHAGFGSDLTEVESIAQELEQHISCYREILEALSAGVSIYGPDKRLKFTNHAYAHMFDMDEEWLRTEPLLGEVLDELHHRRQVAEHADYLAFKKEQTHLVNTLLSPVQDLEHLPDNRTIRRIAAPHPMGGVFFIFEDVTNVLVMERLYNTQLAVQKATLDNLHEGIAVFGSDNRLRLCNPSFRRMWQLPSDFLKSNPHLNQIMDQVKGFYDYSGDWETYKVKLIARATDRDPKKRRIVRKDGIVLDHTYVPLPDGSHLLSYVDVTDSTRIHNILKERNEALERADRLKSEFIANVSYELRTPLNAIIGFSEILLQQFFGELNEQQASYCQHIATASQQLMTLVNNILDLASIEAGYMTLLPQKVDIYKLLKTVSDLFHSRAKDQGLKLEFKCSRQIGFLIGDESRLKQALFNLLSNAVKFTPHGGVVTLSAKKQDQAIMISVSDTGLGIAQKDQSRVFELFERAGTEMTQQGAGLGLSLVKSLIELHGGWLTLSSQVDQGTTVTCYLLEEPGLSFSPPRNPTQPTYETAA